MKRHKKMKKDHIIGRDLKERRYKGMGVLDGPIG